MKKRDPGPNAAARIQRPRLGRQHSKSAGPARPLRSLEAESLIRSSANGASASPPAPGASDGAALGAFAPPAFEKFTDMEELLLLDPIHEVGDTGWPRKPD